jgi:hypothetical protein
LIIERWAENDDNPSIRTTPRSVFDIFWQASNMGVAKKTRKFGAVRIPSSAFPSSPI